MNPQPFELVFIPRIMIFAVYHIWIAHFVAIEMLKIETSLFSVKIDDFYKSVSDNKGFWEFRRAP